MSDPENFLTRWSRRKRAAVEDVPATPPAVPANPVESAPEGQGDGKLREPSSARDAASDKSEEPAFDVTRLPPIDSITAETDIRAFLAPGVPPELTRAALRRLWTADPTIRDFVGLAENAWDFTAPDAIAGFGPLEMTDELRRAVARMFDRELESEADEKPAPTAPAPPDAPSSVESPSELSATAGKEPTQEHRVNVGQRQDEPVNNKVESRSRDELTQRDKVDAAAQHGSEKAEDPRLFAHRSHGRALPE
jgi:hypothetical protein